MDRLVYPEKRSTDEEDHAHRSGEVYVRSPMIMKGYLGDPQATENVFEDGWFKTGDVAYCTQGKWFIIDRVKVARTHRLCRCEACADETLN